MFSLFAPPPVREEGAGSVRRWDMGCGIRIRPDCIGIGRSILLPSSRTWFSCTAGNGWSVS